MSDYEIHKGYEIHENEHIRLGTLFDGANVELRAKAYTGCTFDGSAVVYVHDNCRWNDCDMVDNNYIELDVAPSYLCGAVFFNDLVFYRCHFEAVTFLLSARAAAVVRASIAETRDQRNDGVPGMDVKVLPGRLVKESPDG